MMPGTDGLEKTCRRLNADRRLKDPVPIIFSGIVADHWKTRVNKGRVKGLFPPAARIIVKPVSNEDVLARVAYPTCNCASSDRRVGRKPKLGLEIEACRRAHAGT